MKFLLTFLFLSLSVANAQWWCAFNPSACGADPTPPDRTELCDVPVPDTFTLVFGPPPAGLGCLSNPDKVAYYTNVQTWVVGSESLFTSENASLFEDYGFGKGLKFTKIWGSYKRPLIAFPTPEWGFPIPIVFGPGAEEWPAPYIARGQSDAIAGGACIAKLHPSVPPIRSELNTKNCGKK